MYPSNRKTCIALALWLASTALPSPAIAQHALPGSKLLWSDDFDTLDRNRWHLVHDLKPTNNSLQAYLPEQVNVVDGKLVITATNEPYQQLAYRSGQVRTHASQQYGRWEISAKLPSTRGMWPAIWLLPDTQKYPWPSGGEIDIMEARGDAPTITSCAFHYGGRDPYVHKFLLAEQRTGSADSVVQYDQGFHTYAVDWKPGLLKFYVDGVNFGTMHDQQVQGFLSSQTAPMQLVINNAIGGDFLANPDDTTRWPQTMQVDWVRVYDKAPHLPDHLRNGGFNTQSGGLAGWTTFGLRLNDEPNISLSSDLAAEGKQSLKLFGSFQSHVPYTGVAQGVAVQPGQQVRLSLNSFVRSNDSLEGTRNRALAKVEFYSQADGKYGTQQMLDLQELDIANAWTPKDSWQTHELITTAPAGAVEARVVLVFQQSHLGAGAVYFDQVQLTTH